MTGEGEPRRWEVSILYAVALAGLAVCYYAAAPPRDPGGGAALCSAAGVAVGVASGTIRRGGWPAISAGTMVVAVLHPVAVFCLVVQCSPGRFTSSPGGF